MTLSPESETRLTQLAAIAHAQACRLCRLHRGGTIEIKIRVEGGSKARVSRDSTVTVEEYPLAHRVDDLSDQRDTQSD